MENSQWRSFAIIPQIYSDFVRLQNNVFQDIYAFVNSIIYGFMLWWIVEELALSLSDSETSLLKYLSICCSRTILVFFSIRIFFYHY